MTAKQIRRIVEHVGKKDRMVEQRPIRPARREHPKAVRPRDECTRDGEPQSSPPSRAGGQFFRYLVRNSLLAASLTTLGTFRLRVSIIRSFFWS